MFKNYDFRLVTIGCFNEIGTGGYITRKNTNERLQKVAQCEVDDKSLKQVICVIDDENKNAIDIFSGEFYHILKRDENNRIIEEPQFLEVNKYYALNIKNKKEITESMMYKIYCNHSAKNVLDDYKNNFAGKVKILTKNQKK